MINILLPWLGFVRKGKINTALMCLLLQLTLIGWIPAAIIAVDESELDKLRKEILQRK